MTLWRKLMKKTICKYKGCNEVRIPYTDWMRCPRCKTDYYVPVVSHV